MHHSETYTTYHNVAWCMLGVCNTHHKLTYTTLSHVPTKRCILGGGRGKEKQSKERSCCRRCATQHGTRRAVAEVLLPDKKEKRKNYGEADRHDTRSRKPRNNTQRPKEQRKMVSRRIFLETIRVLIKNSSLFLCLSLAPHPLWLT